LVLVLLLHYLLLFRGLFLSNSRVFRGRKDRTRRRPTLHGSIKFDKKHPNFKQFRFIVVVDVVFDVVVEVVMLNLRCP